LGNTSSKHLKEVKKHNKFRQNILKHTKSVLTLLFAIVTRIGQNYSNQFTRIILAFLCRPMFIRTSLGAAILVHKMNHGRSRVVCASLGSFPLQSLLTRRTEKNSVTIAK